MLSTTQVTDDIKLEFLQEAAIQSQFDHQNVVAVVATVIVDAPMLIILELCGQGELLDILRKTPAPELQWQLAMARDVALGMAYLHSKSFLHRDLAVS
jgi:serine/threonine protein kinase